MYVRALVPSTLSYLTLEEIIDAFKSATGETVKDVYRPAGGGDYFFVELSSREVSFGVLQAGVLQAGGRICRTAERDERADDDAERTSREFSPLSKSDRSKVLRESSSLASSAFRC